MPHIPDDGGRRERKQERCRKHAEGMGCANRYDGESARETMQLVAQEKRDKDQGQGQGKGGNGGKEGNGGTHQFWR